jgi:hypothetical protein
MQLEWKVEGLIPVLEVAATWNDHLPEIDRGSSMQEIESSRVISITLGEPDGFAFVCCASIAEVVGGSISGTGSLCDGG